MMKDGSLLKKNWLDHMAISMAVICGIHCLVTPILLVVLPILTTTFWVDRNFHLWMLFLVIPTTTLAIWSGCRRHKDKWVMAFAVVGLGILVTALITERVAHAQSDVHLYDRVQNAATDSLGPEDLKTGSGSEVHSVGSGCCRLHPAQPEKLGAGDRAVDQKHTLPWHAILNTCGGVFLVAGHSRNFLLCRKANCSHC